ncbi:PQQ-binding-like beta-propeller repeat protein [Labilibaculum sp. K2S]|uniref:outer membrane protein assembly factor BamB family protein n=1 Tax=Labilibaculum sp. K2S TaxID=3056386 RepID=UPI0025A35DD3|nr:PQQ-binding-like beta-propeller repeat protein [Labilibaculum sp. K2S]MDM8160858.1 PQQ-binding-like beta-propeller repeat protein [Labilibaculum sp. K2S]
MKKYFVLLVFLIAVTTSFAQENAQWRGVNRDGIYQETGLLQEWPVDGPELLWHIEGLGEGHASAAVTKDFIYIGGTELENGFVIALDHSGKELWKQVYGKEWMDSYNGVRTSPMVYDGVVYVMSGLGKIVAMSASDGTILWSKNILTDFGSENTRWGITENLVADGNKLYCTPGGSEVSMVALDRKSGKLIWKAKGNGEKSAYCSPALIKLANRNLLVTHTSSSIIGVDAETGTLLWSFDHPNKYSIHPNTPLYKDGYLYCFSGYGKGGVMLNLAEDGSGVKEVWRNELMDNQIGGAVLLDGKIYGSGHTNREWFCLDWKTGEVLHSAKMLSNGNVVYADGKLYCYGDSGEVALVDVSNGSYEKVSSFRVPFGEKQHWAHLVINNKRLYVRHGSSLMVYSIKAN